ncbi:MAG: ATP-binding cassette domain-containing protein, partial [Planctomycetota bacterium]
MAQVVLESVVKKYPNGFEAVKSVDLSIADHEFIVLVGPSGCGKTTSLRMVAGLEDVTSGTIRIGDRVVNDVAPKDRDIAMVFQNYALYPHMTVYKNLAFALKLRKVPRKEIEERVNWAAKTLGLEELLKCR